MEAFSLLKYWKAGATATATAVPLNDIQTDTDDGPFFDLELPNEEEHDTNQIQNDEDDDDNNNDSDSDSDSEEKEFKLTISPTSTSSNDLINLNLILDSDSEPNSKPQFTSSLLKSATKLRVFMLGLKKPKPNAAAPNPKHLKKKKKLFTVKFKVEEVPIVSLFTRDNSSRAKPTQDSSQTQTQTQTAVSSSASHEDKRLMRKYLKIVKPLYVKVSKRYEKVDVSSPESGKAATPPSTVPTTEEEDSEAANVKGLRKHLGKDRSAAVAPPGVSVSVSSKRRDDSLLQQHDWIQGAILHCKNSFNAASTEECEKNDNCL